MFTFSYAGGYTDFYPYLVDLKGWKAEKPTGSKMSGPFGVALTVQRDYSRDGRRLEVTIFKGSMATAMFAPNRKTQGKLLFFWLQMGYSLSNIQEWATKKLLILLKSFP